MQTPDISHHPSFAMHKRQTPRPRVFLRKGEKKKKKRKKHIRTFPADHESILGDWPENIFCIWDIKPMLAVKFIVLGNRRFKERRLVIWSSTLRKPIWGSMLPDLGCEVLSIQLSSRSDESKDLRTKSSLSAGVLRGGKKEIRLMMNSFISYVDERYEKKANLIGKEKERKRERGLNWMHACINEL